MKKKQKIIIAVSAIIVVVIGIIVAVVISNKDNSPENTEEITSNTCAAGYEIIEETEAEIVTEKSTQSNSPVTQAITSDNNKDAEEKVTHEIIQNYKNYDLNTAEIIAEKSASFGKVKLYSAISNSYRVNLIEATSNGKKYYYEFFGSSEIKDIILKNVDGQKGDEIIILAKKSNGTYDNLVITLTQNNMISLLSESEIHEISSMYTSELKENFNVDVYCGSSNKMTINVRNINDKDYIDSCWDSSGKLIEEFTEDPIWFDNTFSSLEAKDVDGDGVCEIICSQYASMGISESFVGYAKTTIKYSAEYNKFVVVNSTFIPAK